MPIYQNLADSVKIEFINNRPLLISHSNSLILIGVGRSAYVFRIKNRRKVIKVFFPTHINFANEEALAYQVVKDIDYFPNIYEYGSNYIVIDYIEGYTLYECLTQGVHIPRFVVKEVDIAIISAQNLGLNPVDIHLRNIIITKQKTIKLIDIARFRQTAHCPQWSDLKAAFDRLYSKPLFPKRIPAPLLNLIAYFYKKFFYHSYPNRNLKRNFDKTSKL